MAHQFKAGIANQVLDIHLATGEEVVQADDVMSLSDESFAEVGTKESGSAGNEDAHGRKAKSDW